MNDPADLGVLEATSLLRRRQLSAAELTEACLRRIEERNGGPPSFDGEPTAINAWARIYPELARSCARAADERLAREGHRRIDLTDAELVERYGLEDLAKAQGSA